MQVSFISKSSSAFINRSLLWCFITHLEDVLGYEHCLQKYLFYHFFISGLLSTPVPALKYRFVRNQALGHLASLHPAREMKHRVPPRQDAPGKRAPAHSQQLLQELPTEWLQSTWGRQVGKLRSIFRAFQCWHLNVMGWNFSLCCYATWITTACIRCRVVSKTPKSEGHHN